MSHRPSELVVLLAPLGEALLVLTLPFLLFLDGPFAGIIDPFLLLFSGPLTFLQPLAALINRLQQQGAATTRASQHQTGLKPGFCPVGFLVRNPHTRRIA